MATAGTQRPSIIRWAAGQQCLIQGSLAWHVLLISCEWLVLSCTTYLSKQQPAAAIYAVLALLLQLVLTVAVTSIASATAAAVTKQLAAHAVQQQWDDKRQLETSKHSSNINDDTHCLHNQTKLLNEPAGGAEIACQPASNVNDKDHNHGHDDYPCTGTYVCVPLSVLLATSIAHQGCSPKGTALSTRSSPHHTATVHYPDWTQLLHDMQSAFDSVKLAMTAATVVRESALQQLAEIMGPEYVNQLRASCAATPYQQLEYVPITKTQPGRSLVHAMDHSVFKLLLSDMAAP
eukprot:jgi/Chrzof1/14956/Cz09g22050.t1